MVRRALTVALVGLVSWALVAGPSGAVLPATGAISSKNMTWKFNWEQTVGSDIEFYETGSGASLKRYAIVGSMGHGFTIFDITDPDLPIPAGAFVDPGVNWQGDVQVDPVRKIVVLATESPGTTLSHVGDGLAFVDISNVAQPRLLGQIGTSSHNSTIIGNNIIYTTQTAQMIDYTNPASPQDLGRVPGMCGGHDITVDPNQRVAYNACGNTNTEIWDISNPRAPVKLSTIRDTRIQITHSAEPSPDSSLLAISDERGGGVSATPLPAGGAHIYDISGKYVPGASLTNPIHVPGLDGKGGHWFPPFTGPLGDQDSTGQWGNVTMHNHTFQAERMLMSVGWYTAGTFVADMTSATLASGGLYNEWKGSQYGEGGTSWGNSMANFVPEGADTWSSKWTRFDDPAYDRMIYTSDMGRGFDVFEYTGPLPKKLSRLKISGTAAGGTVTGKLDRYAVWTSTGFVNKPLAGKTITVSAGNASATVTTGADGSFSAALGLPGGAHMVTATWAGDADYQQTTVTQAVSA